MRLKLKGHWFNKARVVLQTEFGRLEFTDGFCAPGLEPKDEKRLLALVGGGVHPFNLFELAGEAEAKPNPVTSLISASGEDADIERPDIDWLRFKEATRIGFTPSDLKLAAAKGAVRTREDDDGKTVYCKQDLERLKEKGK